MEQSGELKSRPTQIMSNGFFKQSWKKQFNGKKIIFSRNGLGAIGHAWAKKQNKTNFNLDLKCYIKIFKLI